MSSRFATRDSEAVGLLVDRDTELAHRLGAPLDVLGEQRRHGGLDRRERRAQVVRHRGQQRGTQLVHLGELGGSGGLTPELSAPERAAELVRERVHDVAVLGRDLGAPQGEEDAVAEVDRLVSRARIGRRIDATRGLGAPTVRRLREHRDGLEGEGIPKVVGDGEEWIGGRRRADETHESLGFGTRSSRFGRTSGDRRDEPRHDGANVTNTASETTLSRSLIVQLCSGGKKNQLAYSDEVMAVTNAGPVPPSAAAPTTTRRKNSKIDGRPMCSRTWLSTSVKSGGPAMASAHASRRRRGGSEARRWV